MKAIKQTILKILSLFCAVVFICSTFVSVTYAWDSEQRVTNDLSGSKTKFVAVELYLYEKELQDDIAVQALSEEVLIPDTVFYLFKEDGTQIGGRYVTDQNGKISTTLPVGCYYFQEITPHIAYTFDVDDTGEKIKKYPFVVTEQDELVIVKAYNIRLNGNLLIRKTVKNADGQPLTAEQLQTAFTFTVTFSNHSHYTYRIDGGEVKTLSSDGTITLCHGQTAEFENLPQGLGYTVTETPTEKYIISSTGSSGNITAEPSLADFVNTFTEQTLPTDQTTEITVTKRVSGEVTDSDRQREFAMTLTVNGEKTEFTLKADQSQTFEIPVGATYTVTENDYFALGFAACIENGTGTATEEPIAVTVTNIYVGEVKTEISGTKSWNMGEYSGVALPQSINLQLKNGDVLLEEKTVTPNENGLWAYTFVVPKYNADGTEAEYTLTETPMEHYRVTYDGYNITNTYIAPVTAELPQIIKTVSGDNAPRTRFEFVLQGVGMPMPDNGGGNQKSYTLTGAGTLDMGCVTFDQPGVYTYTIYELNKGERGWRYDSSAYTVVYTVIEQNNALVYTCERFKGGASVETIAFHNAYSEVITDKTVEIGGSKTWVHGTNPESNRPDSIVVYLYANGELASQRLVTADDNWQYTFIMPLYDQNGNRITYTVDEADVAHYEKQINGYNLVNTYVEPSGDSTIPDAPPTGERRLSPLWFVLMFVSGAGLVITALMGKKRSAYEGKHARG